jgi:hypothetical protein
MSIRAIDLSRQPSKKTCPKPHRKVTKVAVWSIIYPASLDVIDSDAGPWY